MYVMWLAFNLQHTNQLITLSFYFFLPAPEVDRWFIHLFCWFGWLRGNVSMQCIIGNKVWNEIYIVHVYWSKALYSVLRKNFQNSQFAIAKYWFDLPQYKWNVFDLYKRMCGKFKCKVSKCQTLTKEISRESRYRDRAKDLRFASKTFALIIVICVIQSLNRALLAALFTRFKVKVRVLGIRKMERTETTIFN